MAIGRSHGRTCGNPGVACNACRWGIGLRAGRSPDGRRDCRHPVERCGKGRCREDLGFPLRTAGHLGRLCAYTDLTYAHAGARKQGDWVTTFPDRAQYVKHKDAVQKTEMVTAGARLAQILNEIWP